MCAHSGIEPGLSILLTEGLTTRLVLLKVYPASLLSEAHPARLTLRSLMDYLIQIQVYLLQVYLHLITKERLRRGVRSPLPFWEDEHANNRP